MLWIDRFRKLPTLILILHVTAKVVFAFGLGVLLGKYLGSVGWCFLGAGVLLALPGGYRVLSGK